MTLRLTEAEYEALIAKKSAPKPKQAKYRNKKTTVENVEFDSKREANRWLELRTALKTGKVRNLKRQYVFAIIIDGVRICDYIADAVYEEHRGGEWHRIVEDSKGCKTEVYRIKKKLMRAVLGIEIRET